MHESSSRLAYACSEARRERRRPTEKRPSVGERAERIERFFWLSSSYFWCDAFEKFSKMTARKRLTR